MEFRYSGPDTVTTGAQVPRPAAAAQQRFSSRLPLLLQASPGPTMVCQCCYGMPVLPWFGQSSPTIISKSALAYHRTMYIFT